MPLYSRLKTNTYIDSVTLMALSTAANQIEGVQQAQIAMGSPMNKAVLKETNLLTEELEGATTADLMIALSLTEQASVDDVLAAIDALLTRKPDASDGNSEMVYHTIAAAAEQQPESNLVLISVNGAYAAREAKKALLLDKHVMLFSDNVSLADELALKQLAHERGLLLMGPIVVRQSLMALV